MATEVSGTRSDRTAGFHVRTKEEDRAKLLFITPVTRVWFASQYIQLGVFLTLWKHSLRRIGLLCVVILPLLLSPQASAAARAPTNFQVQRRPLFHSNRPQQINMCRWKMPSKSWPATGILVH